MKFLVKPVEVVARKLEKTLVFWTEHGSQVAHPGDWIVMDGVRSYPVAGHVFNDRYQAVDEMSREEYRKLYAKLHPDSAAGDGDPPEPINEEWRPESVEYHEATREPLKPPTGPPEPLEPTDKEECPQHESPAEAKEWHGIPYKDKPEPADHEQVQDINLKVLDIRDRLARIEMKLSEIQYAALYGRQSPLIDPERLRRWSRR
jgi:hypothetical protein